MLYPLKFKPVYLEKIWGGNYHYRELKRKVKPDAKIGESWEISTVNNVDSEVVNGPLAGNTLSELIEVYMGELVGDVVYDIFGTFFPILIKIIDANEDLSVQVHPTDIVALEKHNSLGKSEMWYVLDAGENGQIIPGFAQKTSAEEFQSKIYGPEIYPFLNKINVKTGDVFYIPSGRVHSLCKGTVVVEIQEASDITYRIYDYNRKDYDGNERELHIKDALDVLDFQVKTDYKTNYELKKNVPVNIVSNIHFTSNLLDINQKVGRDYYTLDSFVIAGCLEGVISIETEGNDIVVLKKGEFALIPADIREVYYTPNEHAIYMEVYYESEILENISGN